MPNVSQTELTTTCPYFQFTLPGQLESIEGVNYLVCRDNIRFRLKDAPINSPKSLTLWQVVPTTDSSGVIQTLSVVASTPAENSQDLTEQCLLIGRVVQLGRRAQFAQLKISRPGEKILKISFLSPDPQMKVGQLYQVIAVRKGDTLHIQRANPIEEVPVSPQEAPQSHLTEFVDPKLQLIGSAAPSPTALQLDSPQVVNNGNAVMASASIPMTIQQPDRRDEPMPPPTEKAQAALVAETQVEDWELGTPKPRKNKGWEWEAFSKTTQRHARVQVFGNRKKPKVYQYSQSINTPIFAAIPDTDSEEQGTLNSHLVVTPLGAAKGIGASCFQIAIGPYEIVLDCGTRPKGYDPLPALEYLENPDLLLISHAHQDHLGAVPVFHARYPGVRMICTPGTREIAHVMLRDCLKVQQMNEDSQALFDETDLERTLFRLETESAGQEFEPLPGLKVRFINAGHILGAACIYLKYGDRSLLYTGDYNTTSSRTTTGLRVADLPPADILITESTYGADVHPARKTQETALLEAIAEIVQGGGNVLIPAFALGRAQEILLAIRTFHLFHKLRVPIYVDGLVRAVTDVFRDNLEFLPPSVQNLVKQNGLEPFFDPKGTPPVIPIGSPRERPLAMAHPSVIVASSGMLTGGASVYYAATLLERENASIFISGYTDEESPGRLLQNLKTGDTIELDGKEVTVRAQIRRFNLSAHADKIGLTQVINKVNPKHLILIHGGGNALHELARSGDLRSKHYIHIPGVGESVSYGQAPEHLTKDQITRIGLPQEFEVEVEAEAEGAWIRIPEEIVENDPRWSMLASSGIIRAKWDGYHLKLSPVTQQNVATQKAIEEAIASGENCCAVCQFFETVRCQCEDSPLFSLQVDPAGKCPEFKRL
ncbi:beta-lactamase domain protein [uncultured Coleofasciculus sp.]|uniref:Beta-lactamase domain protein n=1 Tax=uncultured Coleofasciculus sp. TaxID=1267456 RepID=A0A6J4J9C4_9CYAN|nr:beta-lactamase domain protein [uncultured Coleofasciculus sp.]